MTKSSNNILAINGGRPIRKRLFPPYKVIGSEEKIAVNRVIKSGVLSEFAAKDNQNFYGGKEIRNLEKEWAKFYKKKHAIAVNSATSGLFAAIGAAGIGPGDEVIVSPYSMSASATAPIIYNAVPVFADIEDKYFCLDPKSVEQKITKRTKAILIVDIFGHTYDYKKIHAIAKKNKLIVIEDAAQAPYSFNKKKLSGTLGDIGVFSLNRHKHIQCGEGGVVVTDDDYLAERICMIRNHGECVVESKKTKNIQNTVGFNFRMTEIEASISRCQLKKLKNLVKNRQKNCEFLSKELKKIPAIKSVEIRSNCTHSYYVLPFKFDSTVAHIGRNKFIDAVKKELQPTAGREKEGVRIVCGYYQPLYRLPMFQKKIAYASKGGVWEKKYYNGKVNYNVRQFPVTEQMFNKELFFIDLMHPGCKKKDLKDVVSAFKKVWTHRSSIKNSK